MNKVIRTSIDEDLKRYTGSSKCSIFKRIRLFGWMYSRIWRCAHYYRNGNKLKYMFYGYLLHRCSIKYGFQISPYATIGRGLYLGHFGHIIVSDKTKIGDNVNLAPGVVIGRTNRGEKKGDPTIGSKVWIGSHAVVVGGITIGNNVLIAPNAYVNQDVPDNSIVIGNPCRIIQSEKAIDGYINNVIE